MARAADHTCTGSRYHLWQHGQLRRPTCRPLKLPVPVLSKHSAAPSAREGVCCRCQRSLASGGSAGGGRVTRRRRARLAAPAAEVGREAPAVCVTYVGICEAFAPHVWLLSRLAQAGACLKLHVALRPLSVVARVECGDDLSASERRNPQEQQSGQRSERSCTKVGSQRANGQGW